MRPQHKTMREKAKDVDEYIAGFPPGTPPILMKLGDPDREKAGRVMEAMFKMAKIIIADLEAAAAG
jgi:hypothetical protein